LVVVVVVVEVRLLSTMVTCRQDCGLGEVDALSLPILKMI
jgi:hypothetical protein